MNGRARFGDHHGRIVTAYDAVGWRNLPSGGRPHAADGLASAVRRLLPPFCQKTSRPSVEDFTDTAANCRRLHGQGSPVMVVMGRAGAGTGGSQAGGSRVPGPWPWCSAESSHRRQWRRLHKDRRGYTAQNRDAVVCTRTTTTGIEPNPKWLRWSAPVQTTVLGMGPAALKRARGHCASVIARPARCSSLPPPPGATRCLVD